MAIRYYTRKRAVPLKKGQTVGFTTGKGYYAKAKPVAKVVKPKPAPKKPLLKPTVVQLHKPPAKPIRPKRKPAVRVLLAKLNPRPSVRSQIVKWAYWGAAHEPSIHYREIRPMPLTAALPMTTDCSGFITLCYKLAGAPDPNGLGYSGAGYTGTLLSHGQHIPLAFVQPGDVVVYGPGTGWHTALIVKAGSDPLTVSHGREGGPNYCRVSQDGRLPQTYLRFPTG